MGISIIGRAALGGSLLVLMAGAAAAETVTLRYSNWLPTTYFINTDLIFPWIAEVEKVTEGRVKIEPTPKVVGSAPTQFDVVADGQADIGFVVPGYTPGRFPLIEGFELPFYGDQPAKRSPATWEVYEKNVAPLNIFEGVHVLTLFSGSPAHLFTTKEPIVTVEGLKGAKLRSPQPATTEMLNLLGAVPVVKPVPEIYELAAGGVIDGGIITPETVTGFKLEGVLKQLSFYPGGLASTVNMLAINPDSWERISEQDRAAITAISGAVLAQQSGDAHQKAVDAALSSFEGLGVVRADAAPEVVTQIQGIIAPIEADWIARAKNAGLADPQAMLDDLRAATAK
ncbi:TRAP transporter substrate-binding protein [Pontitalea aquivivens]|uniref:TRAP transporter substrate-binding protein n=1 Tax=Pontitalea aquivivens TaxID=3388663 RepID=UPI003970A645